MLPEKLPSEKKYQYSPTDVFLSPEDLVHGFIMRDYRIGMHVQEFYEINIITRGTGMHYIEGSRLPARCGDVFIIPPKIEHGYEGGEGFDVFHALLNDSFMEKYREELQRLPSFYLLFQAEPLMRARSPKPFHLSLVGNSLRETEKLIDMLAGFRAPTTDIDIIRSSCLAVLLITQLCEAYAANVPSDENGTVSCDEAFMEAITQIHERYAEKITIEKLAQIAHLSRSAFIRKFSEICKMPPNRYLLYRRLEAARHLLLNTGLSASEIAARTGFYDASHFTRTFLAETGCTPIEFRRQNRSSQAE